MYCPRCAAQTTDETNFCNKCGLRLRAVADSLQSRPTSEQFDWSKTWLADMLLTDDERMRRRAAADIEEGPDGATLAEGATTIACVDRDGKLREIPEDLME